MAGRFGPGLNGSIPGEFIAGSKKQRGFIIDNIYRSPEYGDIHFASYVPDTYDGAKPYALFITLPGWEGLHFQGIGANMGEDFGPEAIKYNDEMIIISTQLNDWSENSARETIALTEFLSSYYNIDRNRVYLHGYSGGGETGSLVMGMRPDLYTAYLMTSSQWDGDLSVLAESRTPVYMAIGEDDSYYGSSSLKDAHKKLTELYRRTGLTDREIEKLTVLDVRGEDYFLSEGYKDQHMGGMAFAHEKDIMGWLFGEH